VSDRAILLKHNPRRTVSLRFPESGPPVVVKRYHHPGPIARLYDRSRARQESETLARLARSGVRVPAQARARRAEEGWELETAWIEGAASLAEILEGRFPAPEGTAVSAGRLLAAAHAAGLDHPDLHPGNILVQPDGSTWIVDVRGARIVTAVDAALRRRDLVALIASVRERTSRRTRADFLRAYADALEPAPRAAFSDDPGWIAGIEARARIHRREAVRRSRLRWTRDSSVCRREGDGFAARIPLGQAERVLVVHGLSWRRLLACWYAAARLCEHAVPSVRPLRLSRGPDPCAHFALPHGARNLDAGETADLHGVHRRLRERGLALAGACRDTLMADPDGKLRLGPLVGARLVDCEP